MERKVLIRYLILIGILIICAGAAWFITNSQEVHEDAVLACVYGEAALTAQVPLEDTDCLLSRTDNPSLQACSVAFGAEITDPAERLASL